ncbi:Universal stress protein F [Roseibaca ekhonensis]|jgi:nucleotide-binding universal stress UspA family protein|uniref:Universal stress protein F n=1 Tax=Roseinatronobacter ekhonensis TaxID=254356 RepID=A0A3B0M3S4_9RHOB|nr:universal stress protein [Roseibaca ekhonensis]SUZ30801.1 Universal stress protein F [Roseibaca ekhonensis]
MYSHLLVTVAYEGQHDAAPSLEIAGALAAEGAKVTLLHVMEPAPVFALDYLPDNWREDMHAAIKADLGTLAAQFEHGSAVVVEGDPASEVLEFAQTHGVDCIVVASHRPGTHSLMLGSTANKIVARAPCAVHVARRG